MRKGKRENRRKKGHRDEKEGRKMKEVMKKYR